MSNTSGYQYFVPDIMPEFVKWVGDSVNSDESGVIVCGPIDGIERRLEQLIDDYPQFKDAISLRLFQGDLEDIDDLHRMVAFKKGTENTVKPQLIFIPNAHVLLTDRKARILTELMHLQDRSDRYKFILAFPYNISHPSVIATLGLERRLYRRVFYFPIYDEKEIARFIDHMGEKWDVVITSHMRDQIVKATGGWMWLVNHVLRTLRLSPQTELYDIFHSDEIQFKVADIYSALLPEDQAYLIDLLNGTVKNDQSARMSAQYLEKIGFISHGKIRSNLMDEYLRKRQQKIDLSIKDRHIYLNDVNIDASFSRKEKKILQLLIAQANTIISREGKTKVERVSARY